MTICHTKFCSRDTRAGDSRPGHMKKRADDMPTVNTVHTLIEQIQNDEMTKRVKVDTIKDVLVALEGCHPMMALSWFIPASKHVGGVHRECWTFHEEEFNQRQKHSYGALETTEYLGADHAFVSEFQDLVKWNVEVEQEDSAQLTIFVLGDSPFVVTSVCFLGKGSHAQPVLILDRMEEIL